MNHPSAPSRYGTVKLALTLASIGFALALATSTPPRASATAQPVGPRVLATNCTRLPTEFVTDSDLGAVVVGSQFTRQILTQFGFRPHTYSFGQFGNFSGKLDISPAGKVTGEFDQAGLNFFQVNVTDSAVGVPPPPISRLFFLNAVDQQFSEAPLHFETGTPIAFGTTEQNITLPLAVSGDVYFYSFSPNGGVPPYKLTVLEQKTKRFLPQGLAFDATKNLLYGKPATPTVPGSPANIDILLIDSTGVQVTGHFALDIIQGTITSQSVAIAGQLSLFFGLNKPVDSLSLTMILDKSELNAQGIRSPFDLEGLPIEMTFGGFKLPPDPRKKTGQTGGTTTPTTAVNTFDNQGRIDVPKKHLVLGDVVGQNAGDPTYSIVLDPRSGVLKATFKNIDLIKTIGANFLTFEGQNDPVNRGPVIPINIRIGLTTGKTLDEQTGTFEKTDVIKFVYKRSGSGSFGHGTARLNDNLAPAGIFLINKVKGAEQRVVVDSTFNQTADRVFLQMSGLMRQPGARPVIPATGDQVSVFINRLCLGMFPASSFSVMGDKLIFLNDDPSKGLQSLVIDNKKGTVLITTHGLDPNTDLFGEDVLIAGDPHTVPVTLTIGGADLHKPTFDGQSTVTIFRRGTTIVNK